MRHANAYKHYSENKPRRTRKLPINAALINHPEEGLILFDTGAAEDTEKVNFSLANRLIKAWGMAACDVSKRVEYTEKQRLPAAIAQTGNRIEDVKAIIIGHLHNDHAGTVPPLTAVTVGGLEHFVGTKVPIYVHEEELKEAFWISAQPCPYQRHF